jgi:hypothetical protein
MAAGPEGETLTIRWPRWSLAGVCLLHAALFAWAGYTLPWKGFAPFTAVATLLALLHGATAVLALVRARRALVRAWQGLALVSLALALLAGGAMLHAAVHVARLYGELGEGVAAAVVAAWGLVALVTIPIAWWGLAVTWRPAGRTRRWAVVAAVAAVALGLGATAARAATGVTPPAVDAEQVSSVLAGALGGGMAEPDPAPPSLHTTRPAVCEAPPSDGTHSLLVTHLPRRGGAPKQACLQAPSLEALGRALGAFVERHAKPAPLALDIIASAQPLSDSHPLLDALQLRPGLDGVCLDHKCLAPWQLVALDAFTAHAPIASVPEVRFGFSPTPLRAHLGERPPDAGVGGLVRIATISLLRTSDGALVPLRRLRSVAGSSPDAFRAGARLAEHHVAAAQLPSGVFRYTLDPFTGRAESRDFNMARQGGTTLAVCELAEDRGRASRIARASLDRIARHERRLGDLSALAVPGDRFRLASSTLPLAALLTCRPLIGSEHDGLIGRLGRLLLTMQRPDGSFHPEFDFDLERPTGEDRALFAEGQAVLALVLLEQLQRREPSKHFPAAERLGRAIDRAMDHFAGPYWDHALRDFFFIAENWHCLAARAALASHRHDGYERFCLDYVRYQSRLVADARGGASPELDGGYGIGRVVPPHATPTAGFGEALAAAMAVKRARGVDTRDDEALMARVLTYLLHSQWDDTSCFACARSAFALGGFSEHLASPPIRIDYVQHAWAALGHGGRLLAGED